jgi:hypothetical protein
MTTYAQFTPSNKKAPSFIFVFDGTQYVLTISWNISAKRYYVNCTDPSGNLVFMVPLIRNPNPIEIVSLTYDFLNQRVVVETVTPHGVPIGKIINASIINCVPDTYNGSGLMSALSETEIIYPMLQDPGQATIFGSIDYLISMTKGYFISTFIFRNNTFEINP